MNKYLTVQYLRYKTQVTNDLFLHIFFFFKCQQQINEKLKMREIKKNKKKSG